MFAPRELYLDSRLYELEVFEVSEPEGRERARWQGSADLEALDEDHFVLIARTDEDRQPTR